MAEEFTRGCYGAHFAPGVWTSYGQAWHPPVGRIRWAGAEYAPEWNGSMEGAIRSGEATAEAVAALSLVRGMPWGARRRSRRGSTGRMTASPGNTSTRT